MRSYLHVVDQGFLHEEFSGPWFQRFGGTRDAFVANPGSARALVTAIDVYYEGIALAWALGSDDALGQLRHEMSVVIGRALGSASAAELQANLGHRSFARSGVSLDPEVVRSLSGVLRDRTRRPAHDRDPNGYAEPLLDGLIALVLGEDAAAQRMATDLHMHLDHPRTPPTVHLDGMPHAIDAIVRQDQAGLHAAAAVASNAHAHHAAPTRANPAGPATLIHAVLHLACRAATWRGMQWPASPYLLALTDPPAPVQSTARAAT